MQFSPRLTSAERVAVGGDDLAVLDADHHPAAGAAEAARRLRPFELRVLPGDLDAAPGPEG